MRDLFGHSDTVFSVSALTYAVKDLLEITYDRVSVEGELSNVKRPASGHWYFTLKDAEAQLRGVMWRSQAQRVFFQPKDGMLVRVQGGISLYPTRGDVQLVAYGMELAGEGALQKAFEALKRKLEAEGLFDLVHKKPIPTYPEVIGILTSGTGAAVHDLLSILERRFPQVRVLLCPVQVQGAGAAEQIAEGIEAFNAVPPDDPLRPDVLIVGRGGGSAEDLWAFNEEVLARALFASAIPVVSAVGHETDTSISDFVADLRAATPSMAAELVVPDRREVTAQVLGLHALLREHVTRQIADHRSQLRAWTNSHAFNRPLDRLRQHSQRLDELAPRLNRAMQHRLQYLAQQHTALADRLVVLDPHRPLRQGFAWVTKKGVAVRNAAELDASDVVLLRFQDGERSAEIKK